MVSQYHMNEIVEWTVRVRVRYNFCFEKNELSKDVIQTGVAQTDLKTALCNFFYRKKAKKGREKRKDS